MTDGLIDKLRYWCGYSAPTGLCWEEVKADLSKAADALSRFTTQPSPDEIAGLIGPIEEYLANTEHWELADDSTPDPTPAYAALNKITTALRALAKENARLTTQLLPDEIAGLLKDASDLATQFPGYSWSKLVTELATAIRALVQENAKLKAIAIEIEEESHEDFQTLEAELGGLNIRIRELEAERDKLKTTDWSDIGAVSILKERIRELEADRAKTIEECAKICEPIEGEHFPPSWDATVIERHHATRRWCAAAIRAFAQTEADPDPMT